MAHTVILSPHLDDAVFSCWYSLQAADTKVMTIFAGIPSARTSTLWDRLCGEANSAAMMRARRGENEGVLQRVGVRHRNLMYLDRQYHPAKYSVTEITQAVLAQSPPDAHYLVPLAASRLFRHRDHALVREVGKALRKRGRSVSFYADIPYMGMQHYISGRYTARASKFAGTTVSMELLPLTQAQQAQKRQAMQQYASQYSMTSLASFGRLGRKASVQREVIFWPLT